MLGNPLLCETCTGKALPDEVGHGRGLHDIEGCGMKKYNALLHGTPGNWDIDRKPHSGGGGGTTSTSTPELPAEFKPLANLYTQQATQIAQTPFQAYQGQRYADLNPTQNLGIGMVQDRAMNGSQTMNNAEGNLNQFIQGGQTNPYLDAMVQKAQGSVLGNSAALARRSGSFGNSGIQEQALRQVGDVATNMYGNAYGQDQANRLQAIGMAPTFGNAQYQDASQLLNAGNIQQQQQQNN